MKYLDPKNDLTFKRIFGEHDHLCISLLNSLLPLKDKIKSIKYETGELMPEIPALKDSIVDVRCTDAKGRQFIVEMQMAWTKSFTSRVLLNASKAYVKQLDKSKDYKLLQPVYSLNLVDTIFEKNTKEYYHHYKIVNIHNTKKQIKGLEFVFVELPKFKPSGLSAKKLQVLWLRFLTEIGDGTEEVSEDLRKAKNISEALNYVERSAYTKKQLITYDRFRDSIMTQRTIVVDSEDKGIEKGLALGEAERQKLQQEREELQRALEQERAEKADQVAALEQERTEKERERTEKEEKTAALAAKEQALEQERTAKEANAAALAESEAERKKLEAKITELTKNNNN
jgi:predicted transposase/invertase (TIGR01784 family)